MKFQIVAIAILVALVGPIASQDLTPEMMKQYPDVMENSAQEKKFEEGSMDPAYSGELSKEMIGECLKQLAGSADKIAIDLDLEEVCQSQSFTSLSLKGMQTFMIQCRNLNEKFESALLQTDCKLELESFLDTDSLLPKLNRIVMIRDYCKEKASLGLFEKLLSKNADFLSKVSNVAHMLKRHH